jgi:hypothetical protein
MMVGTLMKKNIDREDKVALKEDAVYLAARTFVCRLDKAYDADKSKLAFGYRKGLCQVLGGLIIALQTPGTTWRAVEQSLSRRGA